ncbi:hypothetical protein L0156_03080 [bacterium]|nr:hypothetical protein [bacterium]
MIEISEKLVLIILYGLISGIGVVGLSVAWRLLSRRRKGWPAPQPAVLIALTFLVGTALLRQVPWFDQDWWLLGIAVLLTVWLSASFASATGWLYLLLPFSMAGIITTVPDTEAPGYLFGILVPTMMFAWRFRSESSGRIGVATLAGIVAWVICYSGQGRPASIVVSIGCLGILAALPLLNVLTRITSKWVMLILHCLSIGTVLVLARTTPHMTRAILAAFAALGILICAALFVPQITKSQIRNSK